MITYEQPLTEKIRLFLRLEALVRRFRYHIKTPEPDDTLAALLILLDLYNLSARIDLKSEVIKETDRLAQAARQWYKSEEEQESLQSILETLGRLTDDLYQLRGQLGEQLRDHAFFNGLRQRASLPGGMNGIDIPLLHYWYCQSEAQQVDELQEWSHSYQVAADAISFSLNLIRNRCEAVEEVAKDGFFQMNLDPRMQVQLLQVTLPDVCVYYPEVSAGKQRFSLRFINTEVLADRGKQQSSEDVTFSLKLCSF